MDYDADEILARMRADSESDWATRLLRRLGRPTRRGTWRSDAEPLTEQERRTLYCLSVGLQLNMTADVLGIGLETVRTHTTKAKRTLGAKNTTHAVAVAIRQGLIP